MRLLFAIALVSANGDVAPGCGAKRPRPDPQPATSVSAAPSGPSLELWGPNVPGLVGEHIDCKEPPCGKTMSSFVVADEKIHIQVRTTSGNTVKIGASTITAKSLIEEVAIPWEPALADNPMDQGADGWIELLVSVEGPTGTTRLRPKLRATNLLTARLYKAAKGEKVLLAGEDPARTGKGIFVAPPAPDSSYVIGPARFRDIEIVGAVTSTYRAGEKCDKLDTGLGDVRRGPSTKTARDDKVVAYERKTGKRLAEKSFAGKMGECPRPATIGPIEPGVGWDHSAVDAWLKTL
jgi:hypothetical protein